MYKRQTQGNSQNEGDTAADNTTYTFTATRSGLTSGVTTVAWAVSRAAGSTLTGDDFGFPTGGFPAGLITFADGQTSQDIVITLAEDSTVEPDEDFVVTLLGNASLTHTPTLTTDLQLTPSMEFNWGTMMGAPLHRQQRSTTTILLTSRSSALQ